ncbi:PREDICTED: uncharacterized protein LOC108553433 [Eufriesea mexicana]|uniref:uncharacterized protein LOC108553433 n=1 Tax=Eufriesea mexicana TaxID=516756 RepID=UPI00083C1814|nr:PREDICTED: uncharacterized protein LOC108553433 [Eufriesea mexicana]
MDIAKLQRYQRYQGFNSFGPRWLLYQYLLTDAKLRHMLNMGPHCGIVTFVTWIMLMVIVVWSLVSAKATISQQKKFEELQKEAEKKIPRKKSVADIRPIYNCIHKHLQQTDVFQEKTKKMLCKERLELEILSSRINCINKLLKPEAQTEWRRSRLPKVYYRAINSAASK